MQLIKLIIIAAVCAALASGALITNGSFEQSEGTPDVSYEPLPADGISITGWQIDGPIDYITGYWTASDGERSLDLNGTEPGIISQTVDTIPGVTYILSFDLAANPDELDDPLKELAVLIGSELTTFTVDPTGATVTDMGWQRQSLAFTAADSLTTITFASNTDGAWGPALDNVDLVEAAVPEPGTFVLLGGALLGLGSLRRLRT